MVKILPFDFLFNTRQMACVAKHPFNSLLVACLNLFTYRSQFTCLHTLHHTFIYLSHTLHHTFIYLSHTLHHTFIYLSHTLHHTFIYLSHTLHNTFIYLSHTLHHTFQGEKLVAETVCPYDKWFSDFGCPNLKHDCPTWQVFTCPKKIVKCGII